MSDSTSAELKEIETQLRLMTNVFMDGADPIVINDLDGRVLDMNFETERVFGWTRDEILGHKATRLLPEEWQDQQIVDRLRKGEVVRNYETAVRTKSGGVVPVLATAFLLTDENGRPVAFAVIGKDITRLKNATEELEKRNCEIRRFVDAVAHDLAAPLSSIRGFSELLQKRCRDQLDEDGNKHVQFVVEGAMRMQRLIQDLVNYARLDGQEIVLAAVDLSKTIEHVLANLHAQIEEQDADVTCDFLPTVHGNEPQLIQLFQNLIDNAIKFRKTDPPRVHITCREFDNDGWRISVRDNGVGIDQDQFDTIFTVFHRLHAYEAYPGSGLGLANCKSIVERHGGKIWVESEKEIGSTFHFTLPAIPRRDRRTR